MPTYPKRIATGDFSGGGTPEISVDLVFPCAVLVVEAFHLERLSHFPTRIGWRLPVRHVSLRQVAVNISFLGWL